MMEKQLTLLRMKGNKYIMIKKKKKKKKKPCSKK